jgi:hypothetical protein
MRLEAIHGTGRPRKSSVRSPVNPIQSRLNAAAVSRAPTSANKRGWKYDAKATSKALIECCIDNGLVPSFWMQHFSGLRAMLESGVPTARNRLSGHGQGSKIVDVPTNLVAYALHMTAATIVFLAAAEKALK